MSSGGGEYAHVRVPATSANLGPGFDSFGVALGLHLTAEAVSPGPERVVTAGHGAGELPTDEQNLVWRSLAHYCRNAGSEVPDVSVQVNNPIPLERGLGSSSAAAVAGLALGRELVSPGVSGADLVDLAAHFEGHPDNAAPAVLGGVVACVDGHPYRFEPVAQLAPVVCVPTTRQSTAQARRVLPQQVSLADAAANGARAAVLLAGLAGAAPFDPAVMVDVLHEPARFAVMTASGSLVSDLRDRGIAACLSGAGPSVLAVVTGADQAAAVADTAGSGFSTHRLTWDLAGVTPVLAGRSASR